MLQYPSNINQLVKSKKGMGAIQFTLYKRPKLISSIKLEEIILYLPNDLRNPMSVAWDQVENKISNDAIDKMAEKGFSGEVISDFAKGLKNNAVKSLTDYAKATSVIDQSRGTTTNPYMAMTFKSVSFRNYKMEFKFTPHNAKDSTEIHNIIKAFRKVALPGRGGTASNPASSDGASRIDWPGEIDMKYIGDCDQWLPKFKKSVITNVDVNFTGQGFYAGMANGFPAETILTLDFSENELLFREDVDRGY